VSLVLNGGVSGNLATQCAYIDSRIVSALPFTVSAWYRSGNNVAASSSRSLVSLVDASAAPGNGVISMRCSRNTNTILTVGTLLRNTTESALTITASASTEINIVSVTTGTTTVITLESAPTDWEVGDFVRLTASFVEITGLNSGRDYLILNISGASVTLNVASEAGGAPSATGTLKPSVWDIDGWNLLVMTCKAAADRRQLYGGYRRTIISTTTAGPSTLDSVIFAACNRIALGALYQSGTIGAPLNGELAHVAVWDGANVSEAQASELLTVAPNLVTWGTPTAYAPFLADANDVIGSNHFTLVGSPDITSDGPSITLSGGGGGSGYLPTIMRAQPINLFGA